MTELEVENIVMRVLERVTTEQRRENELLRRELNIEFSAMKETIGKVNEKGDGGTGLAGTVARNNTRVDDLFRIKHIGLGILTAATFSAALIYMGVKAWVVETVGR